MATMKRTELAKLKQAGCHLLSSGHTKRTAEIVRRGLKSMVVVKVRKTSHGKYAVFTCGKKRSTR